MSAFQQFTDSSADDLHLLKRLSGQADDIRVAGQQARSKAESKVHRHVGRGGMENNPLPEPLARVVIFRFFLQQRSLPAPEAEGGHVRVFPVLPERGRQIVQKRDHPVIERAERLCLFHLFNGFRGADRVLQVLKT